MSGFFRREPDEKAVNKRIKEFQKEVPDWANAGDGKGLNAQVYEQRQDTYTQRVNALKKIQKYGLGLKDPKLQDLVANAMDAYVTKYKIERKEPLSEGASNTSSTVTPLEEPDEGSKSTRFKR